MGKKINMDEIDEQFIVAAVKKDRVQQVSAPPPLTPLPAQSVEQSVQSEKPEEQPMQSTNAETSFSTENQKEDGKRKKNRAQDYEALYIRESNITARLGKMVYIRKEFHDRIQKIVQVIGGNEVSLFSYIDNIIAQHFEAFQDEIVRLYNQRNSSNLF